MLAERARTMHLLQEAARRGRTVEAMRVLAAAAGPGPAPDWAAAAAALGAMTQFERRTAPPRASRRASAERRRAPAPSPRIPYQLSLLPNSRA